MQIFNVKFQGVFVFYIILFLTLPHAVADWHDITFVTLHPSQDESQLKLQKSSLATNFFKINFQLSELQSATGKSLKKVVKKNQIQNEWYLWSSTTFSLAGCYCGTSRAIFWNNWWFPRILHMTSHIKGWGIKSLNETNHGVAQEFLSRKRDHI